MYPRVSSVEVVLPYSLRLLFKDGTSGTVDCTPWLFEFDQGVFAELRDPAAFARVYVNHECGVVEWPNGADVDPETLYAEAHRPAVR
jgi:hypothetical protein